MNLNLNRTLAAVAVMSACVAPATFAAPISWTDWTNASVGIVGGSLTVGLTTVGVTYSGNYSFAQTAGGTNYWSPNAPYLSSRVSNAPGDSGNSDIIGLNAAGTHTITFSSTVHNPLVALVSFNGANVTFAPGSNLNYLSSACGFWGCGSFGSTMRRLKASVTPPVPSPGAPPMVLVCWKWGWLA